MLNKLIIPISILLSALFLSFSNGYSGVEGHGYSLQLILWSLSCMTVTLSPGLAACGWANGATSKIQTPIIILAGAGTSGWAVFWFWFIDPTLGYFLGLLLVLASAISLFLKPVRLTQNPNLRPLIIMAAFVLIYSSITVDHGGLESGAKIAQSRYWVTTDNEIPQVFADKLLEGRSTLLPFLQGDWRSSDRPPLETGMLMAVYGLVTPEARPIAYFCLGIIINSLWILSAWSLFRALRVPEKQVALIVVSIGLIGAVFVNSVYAWPKMLAGAMTLAAMTCVLLSRHGRKDVGFATAGAFAALAMLSHGAALFGLIGFSIYLLISRAIPSAKHIAICSVVAILIYAPWPAYQHYFDPPGDRLLKWQLAGMIDRNDQVKPLQAINQAYLSEGFSGVLKNKVDSLRLYVGDPTFETYKRTDFGPPETDLRPGSVRWFSISRMGPAPLLLLIAFPLFFANGFLRKKHGKFILSNVTISSIVFILLVFGGYPASSAWLHTAPYSILIIWCAAFPIATGNVRGSWLVALAIANAIFFSVLWMFSVPAGTALGPASDLAAFGGSLMEFRAIATISIIAAIALSIRWSTQKVFHYKLKTPNIEVLT